MAKNLTAGTTAGANPFDGSLDPNSPSPRAAQAIKHTNTTQLPESGPNIPKPLTKAAKPTKPAV